MTNNSPTEIRDDISIILSHFPNLTDAMRRQLEMLPALYREWNAKVNVVSRKDIDNIIPNHILHSLAIAKYIHFKPATTICDVGTGGGLPGIPLAILFPECQFTLIDSIGKKVRVAQDIVEQLGLKNVVCIHGRAEEQRLSVQFVVSRAAMKMDELVAIARRMIEKKHNINAMPNGIIALKGGDLTGELARFRKQVEVEEVTNYINEPFFETKKIVYLPL